jgi:hypothetical protein
MHFFAQAPFGADTVAVPHDEHADHDLRINRRTTRVTVIGGEVLAEIS